MYILGIGCFYHDSSAALLRDGDIIAAAGEERFTRKKHDNSFPINAINYCLESQGLTMDDIDYVGFYEKPLVKFERVLHQHIQMFPKSIKTFLSSMPSWMSEKLRVVRILRKRLNYKGDVLFIDHHMAHAASAFLASPFRKAAILTMDAVGEWTTTSYGIGKGSEISLMKEIRFPHSMGLLYSTITAYLGFRVNNSEYKVMGLSAYGNMDSKSNHYYRRLKGVIDIKEDGSFRLDMNYFRYHYSDRMPSDKLCELLGGPVTKRGSKITKRHKDIAAALQLVTEEAIIKILRHVHSVTGCDSIVLAGGVALNSACNGKILRNAPFKKVWIQPDASDGGTSMGVALYIYNTILGHKRSYRLKDVFLGPEFSREEIRSFLDERGIRYHEFRDGKELVRRTAELIHKDMIVGWFQGRMEWGPRALGSRSILANPANPGMKDIINSRVKHREWFRPFAPAVCEGDLLKYFECDEPLPEPTKYMLMVYPIRREFQGRIPAVVHVDGSGRLQSVNKKWNGLFHDLIREFGRLSGVPILLNTSFNVRGEPIVCTPRDAYDCMMGTGIDCLVMDNFLIKKGDNPQHNRKSDMSLESIDMGDTTNKR